MATTAISLPNQPRMYWNEFRYEVIKQLRNKMYAFAVIGFPVMFYLFFGAANRHAQMDGFSVAKYMVASYCVFGMMGSALFGVGVNLAFERGQGWLDVKRASPMPPPALLVAKFGSALCFGLVSALALMVCGALLAGVHFTMGETLRLLGVLAATLVPFAALGLCVSFLVSPTAAPGVMNLIYLPLSFCSGLWLPFQFLPKMLQKVALALPSYHAAELAFHAIGYRPGSFSAATHWTVMIAETAVFVVIAGILYQRSDSRA